MKWIGAEPGKGGESAPSGARCARPGCVAPRFCGKGRRPSGSVRSPRRKDSFSDVYR